MYPNLRIYTLVTEVKLCARVYVSGLDLVYIEVCLGTDFTFCGANDSHSKLPPELHNRKLFHHKLHKYHERKLKRCQHFRCVFELQILRIFLSFNINIFTVTLESCSLSIRLLTLSLVVKVTSQVAVDILSRLLKDRTRLTVGVLLQLFPVLVLTFDLRYLIFCTSQAGCYCCDSADMMLNLQLSGVFKGRVSRAFRLDQACFKPERSKREIWIALKFDAFWCF